MESDSNSPTLEVAAESGSETPANLKLRLCSAIASAIIPGSGQLILGRFRSGVVYLAVFLISALLFWPLRLPVTYRGWALAVVSIFVLFPFSAWSALRLRSERAANGSRWWLLLVLPISMVGISLALNGFSAVAGFHAYKIPTVSMESTISKGDHVYVDLHAYRHTQPSRGDIVVFRHDSVYTIKRVIAVGGQTIEGRSGTVYVNGVELAEPYASHTGNPSEELDFFGPVQVPQGMLFVMGDNRDVSYDSRLPEYGPINQSDLVGRPLYIIRGAVGNRDGVTVR